VGSYRDRTSPAGATGDSPLLAAEARPVIIDLPFPLSTNALYANAGDRGRVKSARYRTWVTAAGWEIKRQRPHAIRGPYSIRITVERKGGRRRDLGNLHKCCSDILVAHGVIADDSDEQEIHMAWSRAVTGCRVEITPIIGG
jgi:Holliday junction resolvase RusA-like endonuclease